MLSTILTALGVIAILGIVLVVLMKKGIIQDKDGDFIPDRLEDMYKDMEGIYQEVNERVVEMKKEYQDVKDALENLKKQISDVGQAAQGQKRQGRKPRNKK